jgi:hypothetical protein
MRNEEILIKCIMKNGLRFYKIETSEEKWQKEKRKKTKLEPQKEESEILSKGHMQISFRFQLKKN